MTSLPPERPGKLHPERLFLLIGIILAAAVIVALIALSVRDDGLQPPPPPPPASGVRDGYTFCSWNVENLFDDLDEPSLRDQVEDWFGTHPALVRQKLRNLARALLTIDDGRGPDILALIEVENLRAVQMLQAELNSRLPTELRYNGLVHRDNRTGRRIEPAILTRLPIEPGPPRSILADLAGGRDGPARGGPHDFGIRRIIEARITLDDHPLWVIAAHWTSRLTDKTGAKRAAYADAITDAVTAILDDDPRADVVICGDFNDEPDDPSVAIHLRATGDLNLIQVHGPPAYLLDLGAGRDPSVYGTYLYRGRWQTLDHLVVAPGLLDSVGWQLVPDSFEVRNGPLFRQNADRRPARFGGPDQDGARGFSDHFAVFARFRIAAPLQLQ